MTNQQALTLAATASGLAMLIVGLLTDVDVLSRVLVITGAFAVVFNVAQLVRGHGSSGSGKDGEKS